MRENEISKIIVDSAYHLHKNLGPGLLESVYETIMAHDLRKRGLNVVRQAKLPIYYDGEKFDNGFRIDLLVENLVLVELKSLEQILAVHKKQVTTYLKLGQFKLGLLINFGDTLIKNGITRLVNGLPEGSP